MGHSPYLHKLIRLLVACDSADILINNAGGSLMATAEEASDEQIRTLFEANYFSMVRVIRAALPLLRKQGSGHMIGVSSSLGITPFPLIGFYGATEAAVETLHEALAQEVKHPR